MGKSKRTTIFIGLAWYRSEQWAALREFCVDKEILEPTYEEWKEEALRAFGEIRSKEEYVVRVDFDLEEFRKWCSANGKKPDGDARASFTTFKLREIHGE